MTKKFDKVDAGTGDVFRDLGYTDAGKRKPRVQLAIQLTRGGSQFWRQQKPTFKFDNGVAEEFRLKQFFTKYLTDPFTASRGKTA